MTGSYAGEALVETVKAGDKRLISYGVDLGTRVTTKFDSAAQVVREIHFRRGILTSRAAVEETKTYTIRNVDGKAKTLVIEHAQRPGYKLLSQPAVETTANAYRFEVKLAAIATETYPVREERVFDQTYSMTNMTPDVLATWIQNKALTDNGRRQLGADRREEARDLDQRPGAQSRQQRSERPRTRPAPHARQHPELEQRERATGAGAAICASTRHDRNQDVRTARYASPFEDRENSTGIRLVVSPGEDRLLMWSRRFRLLASGE